MKIFFSLCLFLFAVTGHAQLNSPGIVQSDSLSYQKPFFALYPAIIRNGDKLTGEEATVLFSKVPEAASLYQQYRRRYRKGIYSYAGFFLGTAIGALGFDQGNRGMAGAGVVLSFGSFISSVVFFSSGEARLKRAISLYNSSVNRP
jgi:hypothetical protein